jgi:hypothetical protein
VVALVKRFDDWNMCEDICIIGGGGRERDGMMWMCTRILYN